MILLYILLGIIGYTVIAGLTMRFFLWLDWTITEKTPSLDDIRRMTTLSVAWPFGLPVVVGVVCLSRLFRLVSGAY